jgi:Lrp/AsnC family transcriptional regulator, regulator for asnA, asnC and gidA
MPRKTGLDEIDRRIVKHLGEDGLCPCKVIAKDVGLSESSVRQRVARMQRDQIFRIRALANNAKLGLLTASVGLKVVEGIPEEIARAIAEIHEVDFVSLCAGTCDINVGVVCESQEHLLDVLTTKVRAAGRVEQTEMRIHVHVVKNELAW